MTITVQVNKFKSIAKQAGLRRGDYQARSRTDKHGEYKPLEVVIFANTTEAQCRTIATEYQVVVFEVDGVVRWNQPIIDATGNAGILIHTV